MNNSSSHRPGTPARETGWIIEHRRECRAEGRHMIFVGLALPATLATLSWVIRGADILADWPVSLAIGFFLTVFGIALFAYGASNFKNPGTFVCRLSKEKFE